jgi:hypothetical protein
LDNKLIAVGCAVARYIVAGLAIITENSFAFPEIPERLSLAKNTVVGEVSCA